MPQYQVDSERIQSSSAAVATSISQIRQAVGGMYTNLNALQDAWRGSAATQFTAVAEQWRAAQQQMEASSPSNARWRKPPPCTLTPKSKLRACLPASFLAPLKEGSQNTKKGLPKESPFSSIS